MGGEWETKREPFFFFGLLLTISPLERRNPRGERQRFVGRPALELAQAEEGGGFFLCATRRSARSRARGGDGDRLVGSTPCSTPCSTPYSTPYSTPCSTPYSTPYPTPCSTPYSTPYTPPYPPPSTPPYTPPYTPRRSPPTQQRREDGSILLGHLPALLDRTPRLIVWSVEELDVNQRDHAESGGGA